jgi:hypothetical protein
MKYFEKTQKNPTEAISAAVEDEQGVEYTLNPIEYSIANKLKFSGGQARLGKISYFN